MKTSKHQFSDYLIKFFLLLLVVSGCVVLFYNLLKSKHTTESIFTDLNSQNLNKELKSIESKIDLKNNAMKIKLAKDKDSIVNIQRSNKLDNKFINIEDLKSKIENNSSMNTEEDIRILKQQIIDQARRDGWEIEIDENWNVKKTQQIER